jgi:hypothetical protein
MVKPCLRLRAKIPILFIGESQWHGQWEQKQMTLRHLAIDIAT